MWSHISCWWSGSTIIYLKTSWWVFLISGKLSCEAVTSVHYCHAGFGSQFRWRPPVPRRAPFLLTCGLLLDAVPVSRCWNDQLYSAHSDHPGLHHRSEVGCNVLISHGVQRRAETAAFNTLPLPLPLPLPVQASSGGVGVASLWRLRDHAEIRSHKDPAACPRSWAHRGATTYRPTTSSLLWAGFRRDCHHVYSGGEFNDIFLKQLR